MTVSTSGTSVSYAGNGTTREFAIPFAWLEAADLVVELIDDGSGIALALVAGEDFTVAPATGSGQGALTVPVAPPEDFTLRIKRETAGGQPTDFEEGGRFASASLEQGLDRAVMIAQEARDTASVSRRNALRAPAGEELGALGPAGARKGRLLSFGADGAAETAIEVAAIDEALALKDVFATLPDAGTRAGRILGFDGDGLVKTPYSAAQIGDAVSVATHSLRSDEADDPVAPLPMTAERVGKMLSFDGAGDPETLFSAEDFAGAVTLATGQIFTDRYPYPDRWAAFDYAGDRNGGTPYIKWLGGEYDNPSQVPGYVAIDRGLDDAIGVHPATGAEYRFGADEPRLVPNHGLVVERGGARNEVVSGHDLSYVDPSEADAFRGFFLTNMTAAWTQSSKAALHGISKAHIAASRLPSKCTLLTATAANATMRFRLDMGEKPLNRAIGWSGATAIGSTGTLTLTGAGGFGFDAGDVGGLVRFNAGAPGFVEIVSINGPVSAEGIVTDRALPGASAANGAVYTASTGGWTLTGRRGWAFGGEFKRVSGSGAWTLTMFDAADDLVALQKTIVFDGANRLGAADPAGFSFEELLSVAGAGSAIDPIFELKAATSGNAIAIDRLDARAFAPDALAEIDSWIFRAAGENPERGFDGVSYAIPPFVTEGGTTVIDAGWLERPHLAPGTAWELADAAGASSIRRDHLVSMLNAAAVPVAAAGMILPPHHGAAASDGDPIERWINRSLAAKTLSGGAEADLEADGLTLEVAAGQARAIDEEPVLGARPIAPADRLTPRGARTIFVYARAPSQDKRTVRMDGSDEGDPVIDTGQTSQPEGLASMTHGGRADGSGAIGGAIAFFAIDLAYARPTGAAPTTWHLSTGGHAPGATFILDGPQGPQGEQGPAGDVASARLDELGAPTADVGMASHRLVNLADGDGAGDAVNKGQLDAAEAAARSLANATGGFAGNTGFGGFRATGLGAAVANADAVNFEQARAIAREAAAPFAARRRWSFTSGVSDFTTNANAVLSAANGILTVNAIAASPRLRTADNLDLAGADIPIVRMRARPLAPNPSLEGKAYWTTAAAPSEEAARMVALADPGLIQNRWIVLEWDLSGDAGYLAATIKRLGFDLASLEEDWEVDWVALGGRQDSAATIERVEAVEDAAAAAFDRTNHMGTQAPSTIAGLDGAVRASRLDQMAAPTAAVAMAGQKITGLGEAAADGEALDLRKAYRMMAETVTPDNFSASGRFWYDLTQAQELSAAYSFPTVTGIGKVAQVTGTGESKSFVARRWQQLVAGRRSRLSARARVTADGSLNGGERVIVRFSVYDAAGLFLSSFSTPGGEIAQADGWVTLSLELAHDDAIALGGAYFAPTFVARGRTAPGFDGTVQFLPPFPRDITDAAEAKNRATHSGAPAADVPMGGFRLTGLAEGADDEDAATVGQLDAIAGRSLDLVPAPLAPVAMGGNRLTGLGEGTEAADAATKGQLDAATGFVAGAGLVLSSMKFRIDNDWFDGRLTGKPLQQLASPTATVSFAGQRLANLAAASASGDAVNKTQLDEVRALAANSAMGIVQRPDARLVATTNLDLNSVETIDGVTTANGNRVLAIGQTAPAQNGVYIVAHGGANWTRATDELVAGASWRVTEGTAGTGALYRLAATPAVVGTDAVTIQLLFKPGSYAAGSGLSLSGSTFAISDAYVDARVTTRRLDEMAAPTAAVSLNSKRITSLADATSASDAVNKTQLDAATAFTAGTGLAKAGLQFRIDAGWVDGRVTAAKLSALAAPDADVSLGEKRLTHVGAGTSGAHAVNKTQLDAVAARKLNALPAPEADVAMAGNRLTGLAAGEEGTDAATVAQLDALGTRSLSDLGAPVTSLQMAGEKIVDLGEGETASDAATVGQVEAAKDRSSHVGAPPLLTAFPADPPIGEKALLSTNAGGMGPGEYVRRPGFGAPVWVKSRGDYKLVEDYGGFDAMIADLQDGDHVVLRSRATYEKSTTIAFGAKAVHVDAGTARIFLDARASGVTVEGGAAGPFPLTEDYEPGSRVLHVAPGAGALSDHFAPLQPIKIFSEAVEPLSRNEGSLPAQRRVAEWASVESVDDGAGTITLVSPLARIRGLDRQLSPPDPEHRATVESYTIANDARIAVPTMSAGFAWEGGIIEHEAGHGEPFDPDPWTPNAMSLTRVPFARIDGLFIPQGYNVGIKLNGCWMPTIDDLRIGRMPDHHMPGQENGGSGYGIALDGTYGAIVRGLRADRCNHAITSGGGALHAIGGADAGEIVMAGHSDAASVSDSVAVNASSAAFDTHTGASFWRFVNCAALGGKTGFHLRGRGHSLTQCVALDTLHGVAVDSESSDIGGSDLPGHSGNGENALASARISGCSLRVAERAIFAGHARVTVDGATHIVCARGHEAISTTGGHLAIRGELDIELTGAIANPVGARLLEVNAALAEFGVDWPVELRLECATRVRGAAATGSGVALFHAASGTSIRVAGPLEAALGGAFGQLRTGSGSFSVSARNAFEVTPDSLPRGFDRVFSDRLASGALELAGDTGALADDGLAALPLPVARVAELVLLGEPDADQASGIDAPAIHILALDQPGSTNETIYALGGAGDFQLVQNSSLATLSETQDGRIGVSYRDGALRIRNRSGAAMSFTIRGTGR